MCGIGGFWEVQADVTSEVLGATARTMVDTIIHRGPDDSGVWVDAASGIALGHRRLSIIDISAGGAQPMTSASGRYTIVYNGEIYNYSALREELEALGCKFRGRSDTEVALEAMELWGVEEALVRFNGMFAFAMWDARDRILILARDRAGKKPLYFCWAGASKPRGAFVFGSELKALHAHPKFEATIDRDALGSLIRYAWIPGPSTIYKNVHKLEPGSFMVVTATGDAKQQVYWSPKEVSERCAGNPFQGDLADATAELDRLLRASVRNRMISDVPLGALLSGGIDSSVVVALMQQMSSQPIRTFAIGFREPKYNEAHYAEAVARHLGTDHTELHVTPAEAREIIPDLPKVYDEPFADVSQIPTLLVSQLARRDVTVALSGDGGDELFLGYHRHFRSARRWKKWKRWPQGLRKLSGAALDLNAHAQWQWTQMFGGGHVTTRRSKPTRAGRGQRLVGRIDASSGTDLSVRMLGHSRGAQLVLGAKDPLSVMSDSSRWPALSDARQEMGAIDYMSYLRDDILVKVDRASMSTSLEVRCPLLDTEIVEFAWSLPTDLRVRGETGKVVLRNLLYEYVPRELTDRPKQGFRVPIGDWIGNELRDWTESLLDERRLRDEGLLDARAVRRVWDQHQQGWANHSSLLWSLVMFQAWNESRP